MSKVIVLAALDNSLAAKPVLTTALALSEVLDASVEPVHVADGPTRVARAEAESVGLALRTVRGPVVERLLEEGAREDVVALVLGTSSTPGGRRPLGSTALAIATALPKPVVVVPPDAEPLDGLGRVLVPIEGGTSESLTPRAIVEVARGRDVDVVVLHVHEIESLPSFTDQPQHEQDEWTREFLRRYCPWSIDDVRLEVRVGRAEDLLPSVARETGADLIALGWAQELAEGRAPVVQAALARGRTPVMLVPVRVPARRRRRSRAPLVGSSVR